MRTVSGCRRSRPSRSSSRPGGRAPETASSRCSSFVSSSFVCERPRRLWTNSITVGTPARDTSAASWSGPDGSRCTVPATSSIDFVAEAEQRLVEEDRLDRPDPLPLDVDRLLGGEPLAGGLRLDQHRRELLRVEMALVEELLCRLDDGRHDPRLADDSAGRADRSVARPARDVADLERELRRARERVAAPVHRRRAGMRRLAAPRDAVALDAERAEDDAERQIERLEDGSLLDVELEVGGRARRAAARASSAESRSTPCAASASGSRDSVTIRQLAQLVLIGHRAGGRARAEQRCGRSARPPRRPS